MCSNASKVTTVVCVVTMMMMMMTMTEAAAMAKAGGQSKHSTHKKSSAVVQTVPLQLDPSVMVLSGIIKPLQNVSISPWAYNISNDTSLVPLLSEARCLLQGCLDLEGQEDLSLESKPIMRQVLLLRRVRSAESGAEQSYQYRLESRLIAVGCTCVRPLVHHQH